MGQQNCCSATQHKMDNNISNNDVDNYKFDKLDFTRHSTYKKLENIASEITQKQKIDTSYNLLVSRIIAFKQENLLKVLKGITIQEQKLQFVSHLDSLDYEFADSLFINLINKQITKYDENDDNEYESCSDIDNIKSFDKDTLQSYYNKGLELIEQKQIATIILAGGQNLRFSLERNKSTCDLGLPSKDSLFSLIAKRILKLNQLATKQQTTNNRIQVYIMTNQDNFNEIKAIWQKNNQFGIESSCITFFIQQILPVVDFEGKFILKSKFKVYKAPTGSGDLFNSLANYGLIKKLQTQQIKYLHVFGVDNLLIKPADPCFIGYAYEQQKDIICKCLQQDSYDDEDYLIIKKNNEYQSIQYQQLVKEIDNQQQNIKLLQSPQLLNNIIINFQFIQDLAQDPIKKFKLAQQFNSVRRKIPFFDVQTDQICYPEQNNAICFEKNLGIYLQICNNLKFLLIDKSEEYAPIITLNGQLSLEKAKADLYSQHKKWIDNQNGIQHEEMNNINIQICPFISYCGEGNILQAIQQYIMTKNDIKYPLFIDQQYLLNNNIKIINNNGTQKQNELDQSNQENVEEEQQTKDNI